MVRTRLVNLIAMIAMSATSVALAEARTVPKVTDLAWMTGSWVGPFGDQTLEENWNLPAAGSIACLVRITGAGQTEMIELIWIEEVDDSLVFRVRQWLPGFVPRRPEPQVMKLASIADRRISFDGVGDSDFKHLTYSRPSDSVFQIDVEPRQGEAFQIRLQRNPGAE